MASRLFRKRRAQRPLALAAALAAVLGAVAITLAAAPTSSTPPTIHGALTEGATLTADPGVWNVDAPPATFAFQWFRCGAPGGGCDPNVPIPGATQQTHTLQAADVGHRLRVQVTAIDANGELSAAIASDPTGATVSASDAAPAAPASITPPVIRGDAVNGETLTARVGQWTGVPAPAFTFLWLRCDAAGGGCAAIPGATSSTYVLTAADVATRLRVQVTATNSEDATVVQSEPTPLVTVPLGPVNTQPPSISGEAVEGETLTASDGQWSGAQPLTFTRQWQRCDVAGESCQPIPGATGQTYVVQALDVGGRIVVVVQAQNADGSASATSAPTAVVEAGLQPGDTIPIDQVSLPSRLVIADAQYQPIRSRAPFTARFRVSDVEGRFVSGALVWFVGIPFGRHQPVPVVATDASGWATFTVRPTVRLPLRRGALLTLFVRATKPGERVIGGVSTRRLMSIRVVPS